MVRYFGIVILVLAVLGAVLLATFLPSLFTLFSGWLLAINLAAFLTYGYDKMIAGSRMVRVPENVLLLFAALGGFVGAALGMLIFRHKTRKPEFQVRFVVAVIIGVMLVAVVFYLTNTFL